MKIEELWGLTVKVRGRKIQVLKPPKSGKYSDGYSHAVFKKKIIYLAEANFPGATLEHEMFHFEQHYDWKTRLAKFFYKLPMFPKDQWLFLMEAAAYAHASKYVPLGHRESEIVRYGLALSQYDEIKRSAKACEKQIRKKIKEGGLY